MTVSIIIKELRFKGIRSSGAGGQHVNKVSSKVELSFNVLNSEGITNEEKSRIISRLASRINKSGNLILQCGDTRSQHRNKELITCRFFDIIKANLHKAKPRKSSRPSKASRRKRLENKKMQALKKANRKKPLL
ncbi:alternative ribosome rescue aminoacyl-tRNA hydrolase ArfB [Aquimarina sp. M1]